jgi:hypothetical protein
MSRIYKEEALPEKLTGFTAPVLSANLLAHVHQLNLDYVELLIAERAAPHCCAQLQHLPVKLHSLLAALSPAARALLAALPFTLYSLGFEDEGFWRAACERLPTSVHASAEQRYAPAESPWPQGTFCDLALLHAWHVATSSRLASRVVYAMPDVTAVRLAATPLWRIKRIAADCPGLLMPRWPTNPGFWPDLLRFAVANDATRLATAKLLGSQLIAAELESAAPRAARAYRSIRSPRLRARKLQFELRSKPSTRA